MNLNPQNVTYAAALEWFAQRKTHYEQLISAIKPHVPVEGVIFDIGANIGYFTSSLIEEIGFQGLVYLFEPVSNLAKLCKTTFKKRNIKSKVFNFGLSDENAKVDLFTSTDGNIGWNTMVSEQAIDMNKLRVQVKIFDELKIKETPTFIKIDVEGAEYKVLSGMLESLKGWSPLPVILCEIGWGQSHPYWQEELQVFNELARYYNFYDLKMFKINIEEIQQTIDIICLPK